MYIDICTCTECSYILLCKWLGYCKISKALISVYTINRKMGLKVCWEATFIHSFIHSHIYGNDNDEHDLFMLFISIWKLKKTERKIQQLNRILILWMPCNCVIVMVGYIRSHEGENIDWVLLVWWMNCIHSDEVWKILLFESKLWNAGKDADFTGPI